MTDIEMTPMMTVIMTAMMTGMTDMMVTNQDIVMVIEERDRDYEDYGTNRKRYRSPCRHDPRNSERYPNCPESQIEEQMDEIVQISVNILKNVNKLLNK